MPYTLDLVRLAASARLAIHDERMACRPAEACDAILEGYSEALGDGGRPYVLAERNSWLRDLAQHELRNPRRFWSALSDLPRCRGRIPSEVRKLLTVGRTGADAEPRFVSRLAGAGSLGRLRLAMLSESRGGLVSREAKALAPSAWWWERPERESRRIWYATIVRRAVRDPDPFLVVHGDWVVRRLAPDCRRIELDDPAEERDELRLLHAMGRESGEHPLGQSARRSESEEGSIPAAAALAS
jgi:hypothetical protein